MMFDMFHTATLPYGRLRNYEEITYMTVKFPLNIPILHVNASGPFSFGVNSKTFSPTCNGLTIFTFGATGAGGEVFDGGIAILKVFLKETLPKIIKNIGRKTSPPLSSWLCAGFLKHF